MPFILHFLAKCPSSPASVALRASSNFVHVSPFLLVHFASAHVVKLHRHGRLLLSTSRLLSLVRRVRHHLRLDVVVVLSRSRPVSSASVCSFTSLGNISNNDDILHKSRDLMFPPSSDIECMHSRCTLNIRMLCCCSDAVVAMIQLRPTPSRSSPSSKHENSSTLAEIARESFCVRVPVMVVSMDLFTGFDSTRLGCTQHLRQVSIQLRHGCLDLPRPSCHWSSPSRESLNVIGSSQVQLL